MQQFCRVIRSWTFLTAFVNSYTDTLFMLLPVQFERLFAYGVNS